MALPCPAGTYGPVEGLQRLRDCTICPAGEVIDCGRHSAQHRAALRLNQAMPWIKKKKKKNACLPTPCWQRPPVLQSVHEINTRLPQRKAERAEKLKPSQLFLGGECGLVAAGYSRGATRSRGRANKWHNFAVAKWVCGVNSMRVIPHRNSVVLYWIHKCLVPNAASPCSPSELGSPAARAPCLPAYKPTPIVYRVHSVAWK